MQINEIFTKLLNADAQYRIVKLGKPIVYSKQSKR